MTSIKIKKGWFTLVEVVIVCTLFAIMVIWVILAVNRAFNFMDNTRLAVRASNLARWWVEMVYNLRDTNWRKCSWNRDKTWLYVWWTKDCTQISSSDLLTEWVYAIKEWVNSNNERYVYLDKINLGSTPIADFYDVEWFFSNPSLISNNKLTFTWDYKYLSWDTIWTGKLDDLLWNGVEFYRILRVYGIFDKLDSCSDGDACPKEVHFCVKVFYYVSWWKHAVELCSIMTNFTE